MMGYGRDDRGTVVRYQARKRDNSLLQRGQTGDGAHPASYRTHTGSSFRGMMGYGRDDRGTVVRYQAKKGIFLFSNEARQEMGPT